MKKWRKIMFYLVSFILVLVVGITLFLNLDPAFGGTPATGLYKNYKNFTEGKFINEIPTGPLMSSTNERSVSDVKDRNPAGQIPVSVPDWNKIKSEQDSITWFGHSTFLLSIDNKKILLDPMLGPIASPVSFAGIKRYQYSQDMLQLIDQMPPIDAVFISHDHYDHLDYQSIIKLNTKVTHFFVPLGVSAHLLRWGVPREKITELNWWDETKFQGLTVTLTPSKHFSGRAILDRNKTLWGGWVILGQQTRLYTSGDGGYDSHFKAIGKEYGPFDLTLIEGGQYDRRWSWVHMTPEEAVQAHMDVNGKNMILMHWGAFTLANHGWSEPVERGLKAAKQADVNLIAPKIGETVALDSELNIPASTWWNLK